MSTARPAKGSRRQHILKCFAHMLEQGPGQKITTAKLARQVGVSEAALYRHFPSKAKMLEALIEFVEESIFSRISIILEEPQSTADRCSQLLLLVLTFSEKNPGISRLLTGEPLTGESTRLRKRVNQFFERIEAHLRQILRESELHGERPPKLDPNTSALLMINLLEGRLGQFVRSDFQKQPTQGWTEHWQLIRTGLFG
ncbi:MAG: nucleoid occlusion factor SlmA [Pseudomonadales bacterium]|nr:nucleoid occlusion factor SlmA [Pseudomonadales bacterium]